MGFHHLYSTKGLNNTLLSQGHFLEMASSAYSEPNIHSKRRGGSEQPLMAQVQLEGQSVVTLSHSPPPILSVYKAVLSVISFWTAATL